MTQTMTQHSQTKPQPAQAIRIYQISLEKAVEIVQRGYPLTVCELQEMEPAETYAPKTYYEHVRPERSRPFDKLALTGESVACLPLPSSLAREVFPTTLQFGPVFCFCSDLVFELSEPEPGFPSVLLLKCEYSCFSTPT